MHQARDTFLQFLNDNLGPGIVVHNLRKDSNFPASSVLQMNALNVQFLTDAACVGISMLTVSVDAIADNELDAVDMSTKAFLLLSASGYTPLLDFTDQSNPPVALGSNLSWDPDVKFRPVFGDTYCRRSALMTLSYHLYQAFTTP